MERTDQDADGRFQGGIFSGQREESEGDAAYRNGAAERDNPQGQQGDYGGRPVNHAGEKQGDYRGAVSGNIGKIYRNVSPYYNAFDDKHRGPYNCVSYENSFYGHGLHNDGYCDHGYYNNSCCNSGCYHNGSNVSGSYGNDTYGSSSCDAGSNDIGSYGSNFGNDNFNYSGSYDSLGSYSSNHSSSYGNIYRKNNAPYDSNFYYNGQCNTKQENFRQSRHPYGFQGCLGQGQPNYGQTDQSRPNHRQAIQGQLNQMAVLIFAAMGMGMLFLAFLATMVFMVCVASGKLSAAGKGEVATVYEKPGTDMPFLADGPEAVVPDPGWEDGEPGVEAGGHGEYYGEIKDAVRTDLSYSIEWVNYEYEGNNDTTLIAIDYPVIEGDIPNIEVLNDVIANEIDYFEEYYAEYSKYMLPEEVFAAYSEGYVTYMDEEVMSVVFSEKIYTDYWVDCGLYCVNIDMENGVVLDNGSILEVNDEFAVDFRTRSRAQNGDVSALDYLTDQEVAYYLTNGSTGIIFYTPLGMEIGLNYGEDYVTVTYRDYKEFLLKY